MNYRALTAVILGTVIGVPAGIGCYTFVYAKGYSYLTNDPAACANCHGTNGHAQTGNEVLAGANKDEMMKKLMDFKSGAKPATIMHQLSKGYTDEQLAAISAWFAAQKK